GRRFGAVHEADDFGFLVAKGFLAADDVEGEVAGGAHDPRGGILRDAVERPGLEGAREGFLDDVFGEVEVFHAENAGEGRDHFRAFMAEQMLDDPGDFGGLLFFFGWVHSSEYTGDEWGCQKKVCDGGIVSD